MSDPYEGKAFIDATCKSCRKRIGYFGRVVDQPACPRCGHKPDRVDLERDQAEMNNFRELLFEIRQRNPDWECWRPLGCKAFSGQAGAGHETI